jgi:hypothetical protein
MVIGQSTIKGSNPIGLDLTKHVFQLHGVDVNGNIAPGALGARYDWLYEYNAMSEPF